MRREIHLFFLLHNESEYITVQVLKRGEEKEVPFYALFFQSKKRELEASQKRYWRGKGNCVSKG